MMATNEMIAELLGWHKVETKRLMNLDREYVETTWYPPNCDSNSYTGRALPPDYTHDLNLVRELEDMLTTQKERTAYYLNLTVAVCEDVTVIFTSDFSDSNFELHPFHLIHATAQQKCDAIYPVLNGRKV